MIAQSNITTMLVLKDLTYAGGKLRSALAVGDLGIYLVGKATSENAGAIADGARYTLATKNVKGVIIETPILTNATEKAYKVDYVAPTSQSLAIGFSGSGTNDIAVVATATDFVFHVYWKDNSKTFGYGQPVKFAAYRAAAGAKSSVVAGGLALNFNKNFSRETPKIIKADVLINHAGTAIGAAADTVVGAAGSKFVTVTDVGANSSVIAIAAGDFFRNGTALTDPCYKVAASTVGITGGILTLEYPLNEACNLLGTTSEFISVANAAAVACGVKLTALDLQTYFEPGIVAYDQTNFSVQLQSGFDGTSITNLTNSFVGSGSGKEVAQNEWFLQGNKGEPWRNGNYSKTVTLEASSTGTYNQTSINYGEVVSRTISGDTNAYGTVLISVPVPGAGNLYATLNTAVSAV